MAIKSEGYVYALFDTPAGRGTIKLLEGGGAKFFTMPALETEKADLDPGRMALINRLTSFDWIIFPDVLAVDYFIEALKATDIDPFELDQLNVFAFGEAVADRLRFSELHADLIAGSTDPERVFRELIDYLAGDDPGRLKFIFPRGEPDHFELTGKLIGETAQVSELQIYRVKPAKDGEIARFKALLSGGAIDELIVSSPVDVLALRFYFSGLDLKLILGEVRVSASELSALTALVEAGLPATMFRPKQ